MGEEDGGVGEGGGRGYAADTKDNLFPHVLLFISCYWKINEFSSVYFFFPYELLLLITALRKVIVLKAPDLHNPRTARQLFPDNDVIFYSRRIAAQNESSNYSPPLFYAQKCTIRS
jgi:hypothetical protein